MKYILKEMTSMEKPREKLLAYGPESLADYELLAILLRTGTKDKSVINIAIEIMNEFINLNYLQEVTIEELMKIKGIGIVKSIEVVTAMELGKRLSKRQKNIKYIRSSSDCYNYLCDDMQNLTQENFVCIYLNSANEIICHKVISIGTLTYTIANPRDVIKWGLKFSAYAIIIAHNHPSGKTYPSEEDKNLTEQIKMAAKTMGMIFIDHLIIGKNAYYSFHEKRIINL